MSKAKRCDRCGKYYDLIPENLPGTKTGPKYSITYYKSLGSMGAEVQAFDLCPECARQLTDWAENPDRIILDTKDFVGVATISPEGDIETQEPSYLQWPEPRGGKIDG